MEYKPYEQTTLSQDQKFLGIPVTYPLDQNEDSINLDNNYVYNYNNSKHNQYLRDSHSSSMLLLNNQNINNSSNMLHLYKQGQEYQSENLF